MLWKQKNVCPIVYFVVRYSLLSAAKSLDGHPTLQAGYISLTALKPSLKPLR